MNPVSIVPVSEALYQSEGRPELDKPAVFEPGFCGRCHRHIDVAPADRILTQRSSWESITPSRTTGLRHLCHACAWAYRSKHLRHHPSIVTRDGYRTITSGADLRAELNGPVPRDTAIIIPILGRRSVAPMAAWGFVTTEHGHLTWDREHARATQAIRDLRAHGVSETAILEPSPPGKLLETVTTATEWEQLHDTWRRLDHVRDDPTTLPLLIKIAREKV